MFLMKNGRGHPDFLLTASALALGTVLLKVLLAGVTVGSVHFGTIDATLVGALLVPTIGAYTTKRVALKEKPA